MNEAVEYRSEPLRCAKCGANTWRVFRGDFTEDGHEYVRLRCARGCRPVVTRRWFVEEEADDLPG